MDRLSPALLFDRTPAGPARPSAHPAARGQGAERAFATFAVLWSMASIFHQIAYPIRHVNGPAFALTLAALWLLLRPSSVGRLLLLAAVQVGWVAYSFPNYVTNHWIFTAFINAAILLSFVTLVATRRHLRVDGGRLFETFAPPARVSLVILYFYTVFHKLNTDYFNPETSCAVDHYRSIASWVWLLPTAAWTYPFAIAGSLLIESAIPLFLCFRRTRVAGLFLGLCFHMMLGVNPNHRFFNFSAMVFAVYFLFLPFNFRDALREILAGTGGGRRVLLWAGSRRAGLALRALVWGAIAVVGGVFLFDATSRIAQLDADLSAISRALWLVYGGLLIAVFLLSVRRWNVVDATSFLVTLRPTHRILWIIPVVVFFNGLNPYLGLKTDSAFSMFSNLRTEGGSTNHFIMPGGIRPVGYQDDLVRVIDASPGRLKTAAEQGYLLTYFELRRITASNPDMSLTYIRDGEMHTVPRVGDDPELSRHFPVWQRMILDFRPVSLSGTRYMCVH